MAQQMPLIPVSQAELNLSAYRLALLLEEVEKCEAAWEEAKKAHKDHLAALREDIRDHRLIIRRAHIEAEEGVMQAQVDALLHQQQERSE